MSLLSIESATKRYATPAGDLQALDGVDLRLERGQTLGLVGESGCGKSTLARAVMGLLPLSSGRIRFDGEDIAALPRPRQLAWRARQQMVFQDPFASLNPRSRIGRILEEPLLLHGRGKATERRARVAAALQRVGLAPQMAARHPHEFSGGQRQRIAIARALMLEPELLVCDEAVSALDVSVRAQVLNLLLELRAERGLALLFISHDLSVVQHLADRVAVMYLGRLVEEAPRAALWARPQHPYTQALIAAVPSTRPGAAATALPALLKGELPSPLQRPGGCAFHPRCPRAIARCSTERPELRPLDGGHRVACHLA
ncbi:MAG: ATP-binding cassette domain-containing protein [Burkholderiaceae bacterium]|nr:ATP-binding cassette domain-containing protein [Burkholderiaceae bacterium]